MEVERARDGQRKNRNFWRKGEEVDPSSSTSFPPFRYEGHSPVKNPTPATQQAFTWNHPNFALSTSAKAARRFALRSMAASEIDPSFSLNDMVEAGRETRVGEGEEGG